MEAKNPPELEPTVQLIMGDITKLENGGENYPIIVQLPVTKTIYNRFRYWMFSKFFPFKVKWLI